MIKKIRQSVKDKCPQKYAELFTKYSFAEAVGKLPFLIRKIICAKVLESLGGEVRLFIVGAADLDCAIVEDFAALGIKVLYFANVLCISLQRRRIFWADWIQRLFSTKSSRRRTPRPRERNLRSCLYLRYSILYRAGLESFKQLIDISTKKYSSRTAFLIRQDNGKYKKIKSTVRLSICIMKTSINSSKKSKTTCSTAYLILPKLLTHYPKKNSTSIYWRALLSISEKTKKHSPFCYQDLTTTASKRMTTEKSSSLTANWGLLKKFTTSGRILAFEIVNPTESLAVGKSRMQRTPIPSVVIRPNSAPPIESSETVCRVKSFYFFANRKPSFRAHTVDFLVEIKIPFFIKWRCYRHTFFGLVSNKNIPFYFASLLLPIWDTSED